VQPVRTERRGDDFGKVTKTDIWQGFALRPDEVIVFTRMLNFVMMRIDGKVVPDAGNLQDAPWLDCAFRDHPAMARADGGNVHFFHQADMCRDLRGQIARLAQIMNVTPSPQLLDDRNEANTFASLRRVV